MIDLLGLLHDGSVDLGEVVSRGHLALVALRGLHDGVMKLLSTDMVYAIRFQFLFGSHGLPC